MLSILLIPLITAMFLAVNMGGSGTAPSFSAAYGADILRKDFIPGLFGIFVFLGAIIAGGKVSVTIGKGILPGEVVTVYLATAILMAVAISLLIANLIKVPQSTSQSTIFALTGASLYFGNLKTHKLMFEIIPTWVILPVAAFLITFLIGRFIYIPIKRRETVAFTNIAQHKALKALVILACCYVAFAIGSNNVANASGPIATMASNYLKIPPEGSSYLFIILLTTLMVAPCFGIGSSVFGNRVVETTGKDIVSFGPLGAVLICTVTATLLLLASVTKGIPTSLVQMNTAAIIGLGISKHGKDRILNRASIKKLLVVWVVAPIIAFILAYAFTASLDLAGLLG